MSDYTKRQASNRLFAASTTSGSSVTLDATTTNLQQAYAKGLDVISTINKYNTFLDTFNDSSVEGYKIAYNYLKTEYEKQYSLNAQKNAQLESLQRYKKRIELVNAIIAYTMAILFICLGAYGILNVIWRKKTPGAPKVGGAPPVDGAP